MLTKMPLCMATTTNIQADNLQIHVIQVNQTVVVGISEPGHVPLWIGRATIREGM